jgi:hypothetical protein
MLMASLRVRRTHLCRRTWFPELIRSLLLGYRQRLNKTQLYSNVSSAVALCKCQSPRGASVASAHYTQPVSFHSSARIVSSSHAMAAPRWVDSDCTLVSAELEAKGCFLGMWSTHMTTVDVEKETGATVITRDSGGWKSAVLADHLCPKQGEKVSFVVMGEGMNESDKNPVSYGTFGAFDPNDLTKILESGQSDFGIFRWVCNSPNTIFPGKDATVELDFSEGGEFGVLSVTAACDGVQRQVVSDKIPLGWLPYVSIGYQSKCTIKSVEFTGTGMLTKSARKS